MLFLAATALALMPQVQQSISLPMHTPIHCNQTVGCTFPAISPNAKVTGIIVSLNSSGTQITDSLNSTWTQDFCARGDGGDCIFHATLSNTYTSYPLVDTLKFNAPSYYAHPNYDVFLFLYEGLWDFTGKGQHGDYADSPLLSAFPECPPGPCPYTWTWPIYAEAGQLLISWTNAFTSPLVPKPGAGFNMEANDGFMAVEDMIAPVEGVYIGSMIWKSKDGAGGSAGHWETGIAAYQRRVQ